MNLLNKFAILFFGVVLFASCNHDFRDKIPVHEKPRWEFSPNMYHSEAYEPVSQIVDSTDKENYNTMPGNNGMNLREPVKGTIKRGFMPYELPKDCLAYAARTLKNPLTINDKTLVEGELLYKRFCAHCHGEAGKGDGLVSEKLAGVANLTSANLKAVTDGHIFHVISKGKGLMGAHGSQILPEERWKIALYVKEKLQKAE